MAGAQNDITGERNEILSRFSTTSWICDKKCLVSLVYWHKGLSGEEIVEPSG